MENESENVSLASNGSGASLFLSWFRQYRGILEDGFRIRFGIIHIRFWTPPVTVVPPLTFASPFQVVVEASGAFLESALAGYSAAVVVGGNEGDAAGADGFHVDV